MIIDPRMPTWADRGRFALGFVVLWLVLLLVLLIVGLALSALS